MVTLTEAKQEDILTITQSKENKSNQAYEREAAQESSSQGTGEDKISKQKSKVLKIPYILLSHTRSIIYNIKQ